MGGGDVLDGMARITENTGTDVTDAFIRGAQAATRIAEGTGCRYALLTDGSPSCGSSFVHDGSFSGITVAGMGVFAALLQRSGIRVFPQTQILELAKDLV